MKRLKGILLPCFFLLLIGAHPSLQAQSEREDPDLAVEKISDEGRTYYKVTIADPFIELHTGPGSGYPIFHVLDRGTVVSVVHRKTDWFRIESEDGISGWASRNQMRQTLLPSGEQFKIVELDQEDFTRRKWVLGVTGGEFENAPVFTIFTGFAFSENLTAELHFGQSVGERSSSEYYKGNLVMQPLPDLKYSPYLALGLGKIKVDPSSTLIAVNSDTNSFAQVGVGIQRHVSRRFLFRFEFNEYIIFSSSATNNDNEEVSEWKFGFAVFF